MYPAQFDYRRAGSVDEALGLLQEHEDAKLMAGGHSLIPMMKLRLAQPPVVIDIGRLDELKGISATNGSVRIGSLTTHAEIAASDVLAAHCPVLAEAAGHIATPRSATAARSAATSPTPTRAPTCRRCWSCGRLGPPAVPVRTRSVVAGDFFQDLLMTDVGEDEILTHVDVPA